MKEIKKIYRGGIMAEAKTYRLEYCMSGFLLGCTVMLLVTSMWINETNEIPENERIGYTSQNFEQNESLRFDMPTEKADILRVARYDDENQTGLIDVWRISHNGSFYWHGELVTENQLIADRMLLFLTNTSEFCKNAA